VPAGVAAERALVLTNEGDTACAISSVRLEGGAPAFAVAATAATVPPHGTQALAVSFRAGGASDGSCTLSFDVDDPTAGHRTVDIRGVSDPDCLAVEPRALDLGSIEAGCGTHQGEVRIENRCSVPVRLDELTLDAPGDFLLLAAPPLGGDVPASSSMPVAVGYRPMDGGIDAGELRIGLGGLPAAEIALAGTAEQALPITDRFATHERPMVDVLFVIDNGRSMAGVAETLANNFHPLLSFAEAQQIDYHFGVTTSGLEPGGDCPGGVGGGEDGRLFPVDGAVGFVTPETPDLEARWAANFQVGACRDGPNQILEAALRAATPPVADSADDPRHPEPADGNAGFLRPEAYLSVVAVTNRPDTSPGTANGYFQALQDVKGYRNAHLFRFSAITGDGETGCARDAQTAAPGDRLLELVGKTGGGVFQSICAPDWSPSLREMSNGTGFEQCFPLTAEPRDQDGDGSIVEGEGEIELRMNGEVVHARGAQGQQIWAYSPEQLAVCFNPLAVPEPGSVIDVVYVPACG
jgi:hypothetical protein